MKVLGVNGSPRKGWNTATLLKHALEGAGSVGAEVELVHLRDVDFKGCSSCFACKRKGNRTCGLCAMKDGLAPVLERALESDVLLLGSPIYLGEVTGAMRSFLERLVFPSVSYGEAIAPGLPGRPHALASGFVYAMGMPHDLVEQVGYGAVFQNNKQLLERLGGPSEYIVSADNYQFDDYGKYEASNFDEAHKARVRAERFPEECRAASDMAARLCTLVAGA